MTAATQLLVAAIADGTVAALLVVVTGLGLAVPVVLFRRAAGV